LLNSFLCSWMLSLVVNAEVLTIDETCTISILNRSVQVAADGSWRIDNVPSFMGQVRARATCVREGQTVSGQTGFRTIDPSVLTLFGDFETVADEVIPVSLDFATGNNTVLFGDQTYFRLRVFANYADGSREDVTRLASGINYTISNPDIATIDQNGVLQGLSSGRVLITARKDGTSASLSVTIVTTGDSDEDGLPDDFEQANGLDPNDPVDAAEDGDGDGLSALDEFFAGTNVNDADTDGDGINDGEEAIAGVDGFITNPLLADSDSDGVNDNLEISVGSDPTDINSVNIGASIAGLSVDPNSAVLTFNSIQGADASVQLSVEGTLLDGESINLTPRSTGTNYDSSDLNVCNFGGRSGEVFAGNNGNCIVTADNSGFNDTSDIDVQSFDPVAINFVLRGDEPRAIFVEQGIAYIGTNDGLQIIDVSNPLAPAEEGVVSLGTNVTDIVVQGDYAYLTTSTVALVVVDISDIINPVAVASLGGTVAATDIVQSRNELYIAAGNEGLWVVNIADPLSPRQINTFQANSSINAVAVSATGNQLAIIDGSRLRLITRQGSGLFTEDGGINLSNPQNVEIENNIAYVADVSNALILVNISDPVNPQVTSVLNWLNSGRPNDVALAGNFAFLADTSFPNGIPIVDIRDPNAPAARAVVDFGVLGLSGADAYAIAVDNQYIYTVTTHGLQIAQYQQFIDNNNLPPTIEITQPLFGDSALEGGTVNVITEVQDDVAVANVKFYADGELLYTDIAPPYEYLLPLPIAQSETEISVLATDYGNNESEVDTVTINLLADSDFDGLSDDDEINIHGTSPFEADTDNDGLSDPTEINLGYDPLDEDMDNDGLFDGEEVSLGEDGYITNPFDPDSDNDAMPDGFESRFGLNPLNANDANLDPDGDGLSNLEEYRLGFDPTSADSDQDGMPDEYERMFGLDPLNPNDFFGDLDDDGVPNGVEYNEGTDPTNPDVTAPEVAAIIPSGGVGLPANIALLVRFNEAIELDSLPDIVATMTETADSSRVVEGIATLSTDGFVLAFDPVLNLQTNTEYDFSLDGARDLAGNPMAVVFSTTITTGDLADTTGPQQLGVNPFDNANDVPVNTLLTLDYNEVIDPTLLNDSNFFLYDNLLREKVAGTIGVSEDGKQLFFMPIEGLLVGRSYYLYVSNIRDLGGNLCTNCGSSQRIDFTTAFAEDNNAPQILTTTIADGASEVPRNARFRVILDEPIGPLFMDDIMLINNSLEVPVAYTISSDRRLITITPSTLLLASADYDLTVAGFKDLSGNETTDLNISFTTGEDSDTSTGSLMGWSIPHAAQDVALNAYLEVDFNERVDPTTINNSSFRLYDQTENRNLEGGWELSNNDTSLRFIPAADLEPDHRYYLYVGYSPYLYDLAGNRLSTNQSRYFNTGGFADSTAPSLIQTNIVEGSEIPVNGRLIVTLDERIGDGCQPEARLVSTSGDVVLPISVASDRQTLTLRPAENLLSSATYSLSLSNLCDFSGNAYSATDIVSFSTSASEVADTTRPTIVSVTPANNATGVSVGTSIVATFNEQIDQTSQPRMSGGGVTVLGTYSVSGNTVTFTPDAPLQGNTQYRFDLYYVSDVSGNIKAGSFHYFTTEALVDSSVPTLTAISPVADAVGINPGATIRLTFSEPMNPGTVSSNNISLYANGTIITPSVSRSVDGQQVSLTANMPTSSIVSVILTDGLTDLSGNALVPLASSFTTGVIDNDTTRPRVVQQIPGNGSSNQFNVDQIVLLMDEPMDAASVEQGLYVSADGVLVDGTIELSGENRTIRFTADTPFAEGAYVQVFLESLATDDSGNAAYDYDGYIRMGITNDLIGTRAFPEAYSPYSNQTGVALNPLIMVRYNEPLDPAALGSALIDLQVDATNVSVPLSVSLDVSGRILQIEPQELLLANTVYELRLDDITDSDGDTNTSFYTPEFTTASDAVEDDRQPVVLAMSPPDGSTNVGFNVNYSVRFDERMNPLSLPTGQLSDVLFSEDNRILRYKQGILPADTEVTETVPAMLDLSGNAVVPVGSTFTTAAIPDITHGTLTGSIGGTVPTNSVIAWVASEAIDPVSITSGGVYLYDRLDRVRVPATVSLSTDGRRIEMVATEALAVGRNYYYYGYYLRDLSGNTFSNYRGSFTTTFADDTTEPQIQDATVSEGQIDVPTNARFNVRFDEPLSPLATLGISLTDEVATAQSITIRFNSDRTIVTVTPNQLLVANADYTLTVSGLEDISGNTQAQPFVVGFTTADTADLLTGNVNRWSIPNAAVDVALNAYLEVELSERIDPTSINVSTFRLVDNTENRNVVGDWALSNNGMTLRFIPAVDLEADHRYTLYAGRYSSYFKDLAGNNVTGTTRYFNTGGFADSTAPSLIQTNIVEGSEIPVNGRLIVTLDERIGDGCQPEARLVSTSGDVVLPISVASDRQTLTLRPAENLLSSATYSLSLSNLCDFSGNAYSATDIVSFSTSASEVADTTRPTIVSVTPANNATGVSVGTSIVATFNEQIDQTSQPRMSGGGVTVLGTYSVSGNTVTFTPDAPLQGNTQYRFDLYYVSDVSGNINQAVFHYFTTEVL